MWLVLQMFILAFILAVGLVCLLFIKQTHAAAAAVTLHQSWLSSSESTAESLNACFILFIAG